MNLDESEKDAAIKSFIDLVRFPTVSALGPTNSSYVDCVEYLKSYCLEIGLSEVEILECSKINKPILKASWIGSQPNLPVIVLNSHYDVVPAIPEDWTVEPFQGTRKDGKIYGRGTQDMKCVCIQYLVAIRKLMVSGFIPVRSIHLTFVPDEEIGGSIFPSSLSERYSYLKTNSTVIL